MMNEPNFDVLIVGGGAAGLSAALVLGRARRRVVVIDAGAPRNARAAHMQGFLSRDGMPPAELLAAGRAEVAGYGVELVNDRVLDINPGFTVQLASGRRLIARRVLIATGVSDELPAITGVRERWGETCSTAPTATAGKFATSHSACSAPCPAPLTTRYSSASGLTT
jgi:thioredoxin reductase